MSVFTRLILKGFNKKLCINLEAAQIPKQQLCHCLKAYESNCVHLQEHLPSGPHAPLFSFAFPRHQQNFDLFSYTWEQISLSRVGRSPRITNGIDQKTTLFKIHILNATLFFQKLTNAWTLSWWRCWKVARSTCPSSIGLRLINSGWIFSSRALTSHSCLCFTLRYGFASRPSKFGSPAPDNKSMK